MPLVNLSSYFPMHSCKWLTHGASTIVFVVIVGLVIETGAGGPRHSGPQRVRQRRTAENSVYMLSSRDCCARDGRGPEKSRTLRELSDRP